MKVEQTTPFRWAHRWDGKRWRRISMFLLRPGDIVRMYEPTGESVTCNGSLTMQIEKIGAVASKGEWVKFDITATPCSAPVRQISGYPSTPMTEGDEKR